MLPTGTCAAPSDHPATMTASSGFATRIRFVVCAPSSRPASSVTAANTADVDGCRATSVATRRIAACSRMICSDAPMVADAPTIRL